MELENKFEELLDEFKFKKVHKVMKKLNWMWALNDGLKVPEISEMKTMCRQLFFECLADLERRSEGRSEMSSGGFDVYVDNGGFIELKFVLEQRHAGDE